MCVAASLGMAEFRYGRIVLRRAQPDSEGSDLSHGELRELQGELRGAVDDPMAMRELARFLGATIVYTGEALLELLSERLMSGLVIVARERARTIDSELGLQPVTLARYAENPLDEDDRQHVVAMMLIGEDDEPIAGVRYRMELPDGTVVEGRTDDEGRALAWGLARAGDCKLSFPDLDHRAWEAVRSDPL